jgi:hypothetical protein
MHLPRATEILVVTHPAKLDSQGAQLAIRRGVKGTAVPDAPTAPIPVLLTMFSRNGNVSGARSDVTTCNFPTETRPVATWTHLNGKVSAEA